jgi:hypothetical protein
MAAINDGRWVTSKDVPELGDLRIKMRGAQSAAARDMQAALVRGGATVGDAFERVVKDHCLIDIEGLTSGSEVIGIDELRPMLDDEATEPLGILLLRAVQAVDATREADAKAAEKN